jgi:hypothetical protein
MKTLHLPILAYLILLASVTSAQDNVGDRNTFQVGILGGFNYSNAYHIQGQNFATNSLIGPVGGAFLSIPAGIYLGAQPELMFSQKGFTARGADATGTYSYLKKSDYIDLPLLIQFKPAAPIYILAGPEYSRLLSNKYIFTQDLTGENTQGEFNNNSLRRNIFGLMCGADVNLNELSLGFRIAWDLMNDNSSATSYLPFYRSLWGQMTAGIRF